MNWHKLQNQTRLYRRDNPKYRTLLQNLIKYQRRMRRRPTKAETRMKAILYELHGFKSLRTKKARKVIRCQRIFVVRTPHGAMKGYITDFYLPKYGLAIEVDGDSHDNKQDYDLKRDQALKKYKGIRTLHVSNLQTTDKQACFEILQNAIDQPVASRQPKPKRKIIRIDRDKELQMQAEWLKTHKVTVVANA